MSFRKIFGVVKKVAKVGQAVAKVVPIPGVAAAEALIAKGTKRFSIDLVGAKKIVKGIGVGGAGAPVGLFIMGITSSWLPAFVLVDPVRDATVAAFVALGGVLVNVVRKFLTSHPEIKAVVDQALDAAK
jgi:hypothetical protein